MKKAMSIAAKSGKELLRDPQALFFVLMFPAIFMLVFGAAFSESITGNTTYDLAIINLDSGVEGFPQESMTTNFGDEFEDILKEMEYPQEENGTGSSEKVFNIKTDLDRDDAEDSLKKRDLDALIIIPEDFSSALASEVNSYLQSHIPDISGMEGSKNISIQDLPTFATNVTAQVIIQGDKGSQEYYTTYSIIIGFFQSYKDTAKQMALNQTNLYLKSEGVGVQLKSAEEKLTLVEEEIEGTSDFTVFDYIVPGMIVFGILMGGIGVVSTLSEERERETLRRLKITKMRSFDLMFGTLVPYAILGFFQVIILFGVALLIGYSYNPDGSILLAGLIGMIGGIATVSLGLIMAAFVSNPKQAGTIGPLVTVPLSFLIGAFFPVPNPTIIPDFYGKGQDFGLWDFLPWRQCSLSLSEVLTYGEGIGEITTELTLMIIQTVILFIVGVFLYNKYQMKPE